jgi:hypothetical protein
LAARSAQASRASADRLLSLQKDFFRLSIGAESVRPETSRALSQSGESQGRRGKSAACQTE